MKRYQVSKYFVYTFFVGVISILLLLCYLTELLRFHYPVTVNEFNVGILRNNQYALVTSKECVSTGKKGMGNALSGTFIFTKEYKDYALRLGNSAFLEVSLSEPKLIDEIATWPMGKGSTPVTFIGRVTVEAPERHSLKKYEGAEGFQTDQLMRGTHIIQVTKEEVVQKHRILLFFGGGGLLLALLMFFSFAGIRKVYVKPFEDSKRYKDYYLGRVYRMEEDLEREKKHLESLLEQQKSMKKNFWISFSVCLGSFLLFLFFAYLYLFGSASVMTAAALYPMLFFFYVTCFACKWVFQSYLNSDRQEAERISDLFLLRTISVRITESKKLISVMTKTMKDREEKERQEQEENGTQPVQMWYGPGVWEEPGE